jgi:hypothetical protein
MLTVERRVHFTILESTTTNNMITGNSGNNILAGPTLWTAEPGRIPRPMQPQRPV